MRVEIVEAAQGLAYQRAATVDADPELELVRRPALSTVLFRARPRLGGGLGGGPVTDEEADALVRPLRDALFAEGRSLVAATVVDGRPCLKLTVLDPHLADEDVAMVLADVRDAARYLATGMRRATTAGVLI